MGKAGTTTPEGSKQILIKSSSNLAAAVLLVLALTVIVTLLSGRHYLRWDLTAAREHTLNAKTLQVLKTILEPVTIKAFVQEDYAGSGETGKLLAAYRYRAPNITYELIDPDSNPALARRYNVRSLNTLVLEGYQSSQTVKIADEENITNALVRLSRKESLNVYWLTGHSERPFMGPEAEALTPLQETLSRENYRFQEINLMRGDIPGDASLIVAAAPARPLFPVEIESIGRYLNRGGSVIVFLEPFEDGGLRDFLKGYGILIAPDIIIDKLSRVMGGDYLLPMAADYGTHRITEDFRLTSLFSVARSVEASREETEGVTLTPLAFTSPDSWAETDREALNEGKVGLDEVDRKGPLSLAVIAELTPPIRKETGGGAKGEEQPPGITGPGKLVVFGDSDFCSNKFYGISGNGDFITNTVNYLVGRKDLITIEKKHRAVQALSLTRRQGMVLFWVPVVIMPLIILVTGLLVWRRRRAR